MGNNPPPVKKQDPSEILFQMKLTSKKFFREANKAEKEYQLTLKKAKDCLKKGNEDSARLYISQSNQKLSEKKNYERMAHRFNYIYGQVKNQNMTKEMTDHLNTITPFLKDFDDDNFIKNNSMKLDNFNTAFNKYTVNNKIIFEDITEKLNGDDCTNDEDLLTNLKKEVNLEMGMKNNIDFKLEDKDENKLNNDYFEDLKNL